MISPLYVIKVGSSTVLSPDNTVYKEVKRLSEKGNKILLVAGGAKGIEEYYQTIQREVTFLELNNGNQARYCTTEEMNHIHDAYQQVMIPALTNGLRDQGLKTFVQCAGDQGLVLGKQGPPLKVVKEGKKGIVRDSLYGNYDSCDKLLMESLLDHYDVVCLTPPIQNAAHSQQYLNIDADMLAAHLAIAMNAHHLRFVTGTNGLLQDVDDPDSTVKDIYLDDPLDYVQGRMKQKVRAAQSAIRLGICDVAIMGPSMSHAQSSWFWGMEDADNSYDLMNKVVRIPSVSHNEEELTQYLLHHIQIPGVINAVDRAGNIVFEKGDGDHTLLLLGHVDTVPHLWKVQSDETTISGRGVVDAKGCFVNFVQMLKDVQVPNNCKLKVIGAVEEEVSSSAGAYYVRDHHSADAVIIGEPSGQNNLTLGYHGLLKLGITINKGQKHSASRDNVSVADQFFMIKEELGDRMKDIDPDHVATTTRINQYKEEDRDVLKAILNFRISPGVREDYARQLDLSVSEEITIDVLRATPGFINKRNCSLVKSFAKSFANQKVKCKYLKKTGTSDMNTLATTWTDVPIIAYGPGDSNLDHTNQEFQTYSEIDQSRIILKDAIENWFSRVTEVEKRAYRQRVSQ
ncbi:M20/M25/M40 family metallo-hydrolase [Gracilibacillus caseinilyticus]|uniref:M20/M25/M40 family metallo-hydrolase n=1 Tax=Gracilibacillus caseinilyticus TaxID=2932256 RepID=A0ABY4F158_9BACI|nr:M20/M25/M40 family metallo-hydrolase [Gracilibacillus caseinilyticus]UOQ49817.1 M20/M25/M40 family metallo-hydrolase [Gracilibacillus caseinilyticus]